MQGVDGVEFITFDKSRGWRAYGDVRRQLAGRRFPVLLHMHASMRANLASAAVRADTRLGFDRARARDYQWLFTNERVAAVADQHVLDGMMSFAEHLGIVQRTLRWDIPVPDADRAFARQLCGAPGPACVISPCSSQRFRNYRNWSATRYIELIDHLHNTHDANVILTGGPTEMEARYGREIEQGTRRKPVNLIGATTLKRLLAIIDESHLVICPDSGPAHMATTVGTPVVGLYATSNRWRTGPYFSQHLVADRYPDAIRQEFNKDTGEMPWGQRVRNADAMNLIELVDVTQKVDLVLGAARSGVHPAPGPA